MMKTTYLLTIGACISLSNTLYAGPKELTLESPDGKVKWMLSVDEGKVQQSLKKGGKTVLEKDNLGLVVDGKDLGEGTTGWNLTATSSVQEKQFPVRGKHGKGSVKYKEYMVEGEGSDLVIHARMFDDGVAFRYVWGKGMKDKNEVKVTDEATSFRFPTQAVMWTQDSNAALGPCEGVWTPSRISDFKVDKENPRSYIRTASITVELPGGGYALIQEAANFGLNWSGIKFALEDGKCKATYFQNQDGFTVKPDGDMPWRVVLVTDDLNTLVNSDLIESLPPAPDRKLFPKGSATAWIKPGRSSWTWWDSMSAKNDDQYKFVDMASDFGWEYHLVDEGWKKWDKDYKTCLEMMKKLTDYAAGKKVGIWAWIRWSDINKPDNNWEQMRDFMTDMKKAGVKGLKVDFMDSASQERLHFYDAMMVNTAENQIMINFHGANTPGGEPRTWPHELSREGIYGGEQNLWGTLSPEHLSALPFTRLVSGHADFTGGYFGHGPKLKGSSWTLQMASNIIYTSPILHWVGNPTDMPLAFPAGSPERKLIETIPSTWDETIVLPHAKIGKYAPFARRNGKQWFVALINGPDARTEKIKLDFVADGKYTMVMLTDLEDKNDGWKVETREVSKGDTLDFTMRPAGGGIVWLVPAN